MTPHPLPVILHRWLLATLRPVLDREYLWDASATFEDLYRESRSAPLRQRVRLWVREITALAKTAFAEVTRSGTGAGIRDPRGTSRPPKAKRHRRETSSLFDNLGRDLRYAVRSMARSPLFVTVSVSSLALSIAAATAVFTVINARFLRQDSHVRQPDQLVRIFGSHRNVPYGPLSYSDIVEIRDQSSTLQDVASFRSATFVVTQKEHATRQVYGEQVSDNWFGMLGVPMAAGRGFIPADSDPGVLVAVMGYGMWDREYGRDPGVLGSTIRLNGRMHTIVGIAPQGLRAHEDPTQPDLWTLIPQHIREDRGRIGLKAVGRMRDGATPAEVRGELDLIARRLVQEYPDQWIGSDGQNRGLAVLTDKAGRLPPNQRAETVGMLLVLTAVVSLILLIACSNVANLLLTRACRRRTEIAVRLSLGAGRGRLVRQLLLEGVLLAILAGGCGLLAILWLTTALANGVLFAPLPATVDLSVDWRVASFALALALITGVLFSLVPALQASNPSLIPALKGVESVGRLRRFSTRNILVVVQVAASMILVFSAALLVRSLQQARSLDIGFNPRNIAIVGLDLRYRDYGPEQAAQFYADLLERVGRLPGVDGAALGDRVPLEGGSSLWGGLKPEGYQPRPGEFITVNFNTVSPGYFDLIEVPLLAGREFDDTDRTGGQRVAIVNQAFADRFWPGEDAVGKTVVAGDGYQIVGMVRDAKYVTISEDRQPHIWVPVAQSESLDHRIHVRVRGRPADVLPLIREQIHALDPDLPIVESRTMRSLTARGVLPYRIASIVLTGAGLVALGLAMMGVYGVIAYAVSQRTREVGIRVAVGAKRGSVVGMIVRDGLSLAAVGALVCLPLIFIVSQLIKTFVVGVPALDPVSLVGGVGVVALTSTLASLVPALRAARVHPTIALRGE